MYDRSVFHKLRKEIPPAPEVEQRVERMLSSVQSSVLRGSDPEERGRDTQRAESGHHSWNGLRLYLGGENGTIRVEKGGVCPKRSDGLPQAAAQPALAQRADGLSVQ